MASLPSPPLHALVMAEEGKSAAVAAAAVAPDNQACHHAVNMGQHAPAFQPPPSLRTYSHSIFPPTNHAHELLRVLKHPSRQPGRRGLAVAPHQPHRAQPLRGVPCRRRRRRPQGAGRRGGSCQRSNPCPHFQLQQVKYALKSTTAQCKARPLHVPAKAAPPPSRLSPMACLFFCTCAAQEKSWAPAQAHYAANHSEAAQHSTAQRSKSQHSAAQSSAAAVPHRKRRLPGWRAPPACPRSTARAGRPGRWEPRGRPAPPPPPAPLPAGGPHGDKPRWLSVSSRKRATRGPHA